MLLRNTKKLILNSTVEGDSPGTFMTPNSSPVGRVQEILTSIPENHPFFEAINVHYMHNEALSRSVKKF